MNLNDYIAEMEKLVDSLPKTFSNNLEVTNTTLVLGILLGKIDLLGDMQPKFSPVNIEYHPGFITLAKKVNDYAQMIQKEINERF